MTTLTATEIVDLYLAEVGVPTWGNDPVDDDGICYFGPYPAKNPRIDGGAYFYLTKDTLTRLVWGCRHEAPSRSAVRDALAVLKALATRKNNDKRFAEMLEQG